MHRFVYLKLKGKAQLDSHRSPVKHSKLADKISGNDGLPVLELSLPDCKSFRASVILPDLSRRFTLLRTNGELLPIDTFQQRLRQERESGYITQQDESILLQQYRQQFLSEKQSAGSPVAQRFPPTSPHRANSLPASPRYRKPSSAAANGLFSAGTSVRDAAYIRKARKVSSPSCDPSIIQSNVHSLATARCKDSEIFNTIEGIPKNSPISTDLDRQFDTALDHHIHPHPLDFVDEESEGDGTWEIEVTATQLHRLSCTMNRILGSHLEEHPRAIPPSSDLVDHHALAESAHYAPFPARFVHSNSGSFSLREAEVRVHEELLKALPDTSSSPKAESIDHHLNRDPASQDDDQPFLNPDDADPSLPEGRPRSSSPISATLSESTSRSQLLDEGLGFIDDSGFRDGTSDFEFNSSDRDELLEPPLPALDRENVPSLFDLHYDELLFVQELLSSSTSAPHHPAKHFQGQDPLSPHNSPISPLSTQSPGSVAQYLGRELSVSSSFPGNAVERHNSPHGQDPSSQFISARRLSPHSPKPKIAVGIGFCQKMRAPRGTADRLQSPTLSPNGSQSPIPILVSPSSTDSPDGFSFALTPPNDPFARFPRTCQSSIPSPSMKLASNEVLSDSAPGAAHHPRRRQTPSRTCRPIPTTILFRDVEAKAAAANFALNKIPAAGFEGLDKSKKTLLKSKKTHSRKKVISIAQIGVPKLVSASANLPALQLEEAGDDMR